MGKTTIEWCDHTVNPIKARDMRSNRVGHHCVKISPGCANCYASAMQPMRFGLPEFDQKRHVQCFLDRKALDGVLRRQEPTVYFWEDMSDLFGEWNQPKWIDECFAYMALTPRHTHLVLTKRVDNLFSYMTRHAAGGHRVVEHTIDVLKRNPKVKRPTEAYWPLRNVYFGASVENQPCADQRLPVLLSTPAAGHFLSVEPQLGAITLKWAACSCVDKPVAFKNKRHDRNCALSDPARRLFNLVINGGESGRGARPFNLQWPRSIIRQCHENGWPVFIKQLGSFPTLTPIGTKEFDAHPTKPIRLKLKSRKGGKMDEWPDDLRVREPFAKLIPTSA